MKSKFLKCFILVFFLSYSSPVYAIPIAPLKTLTKKIASFFDNFLGSGDDVFRQLNKADDTVKTKIDNLSDEEFILSKIGNDTHDIHLSTALNGSNAKISTYHGVKLKKIGKKIINDSDNLIDLYDLDFNSNDQNIKSSSFFIKNWIGKIYRPRTENYQFTEEKRYLFTCVNKVEVFYFTIFLDSKEDINRAFITDHKYFYSKNKALDRQELLIIKDEPEIKIMSTKPKHKDDIYLNLFKISRDGRFQHVKNISNLNKKKIDELKLRKNIEDFCKKNN